VERVAEPVVIEYLGSTPHSFPARAVHDRSDRVPTGLVNVHMC